MSLRSDSALSIRADPCTSTVAQTKLVAGFLTGIAVYILFLLFTLPFLPLSIFVFPILLWMTLRWLEDLTSSLRASLALFRLLYLGKSQLVMLRTMREGLRVRVEDLAVQRCGLPRDAEKYFLAEEKRRPRWKEASGFFSIKRRRKKGESRSSARLAFGPSERTS